MTVTPEMLIAYVDGEADKETVATVEREAAADPQLAAEIARHRAARDRVSAAFAGALEEPAPDRLVQAIMAGGDDKIVALAEHRTARTRRWLGIAAGMAACLVVGVGIGNRFAAQGPIGSDFSVRGQLATALDRQLASQPGPDDTVRIGVSFRTAQGGYCRTFQTSGGKGVAGVACHEDRGWRAIIATPQPTTPTEYRTAASAPQVVLRTAEAMMSGEPLDADAEARARDKGWR